MTSYIMLHLNSSTKENDNVLKSQNGSGEKITHTHCLVLAQYLMQSKDVLTCLNYPYHRSVSMLTIMTLLKIVFKIGTRKYHKLSVSDA